MLPILSQPSRAKKKNECLCKKEKGKKKKRKKKEYTDYHEIEKEI
jgi:hypothetical protein